MLKGIIVALIGAVGAIVAAFVSNRLKSRSGDENGGKPKTADQAAAICYRRTTTSIEFLLVKSDGGRWIFPKGHIDPGEQIWEAAKREAFEEAGASGTISPEVLTTFLHAKRGKKQRITELRVAAIPLLVKSTQPSREVERNPTWFDPQQAIVALREDRDFKYADELERVVRSALTFLVI